MKKYLPYIIGGLALIVLLALVFTGPVNKTKKLDERITLRQHDKIPYGTFVAYSLLQHLFPQASVSTDKKAPSYWNEVSAATDNQAVFLMAKTFEPEEYELKRLADFVNNGNFVFIIANSLSYEAAAYFKVRDADSYFYVAGEDSLGISLNNPPFAKEASYLYPGKKFDNYFSSVDTAHAYFLGNDRGGNTDFIQLQAGKGKLFIHLAPLAFSNYFILHKNNLQYFQKAVSLIPGSVQKVVWNEYYLTKRKINTEQEPHILSVLWQYPSFRWGFIAAFATLALYTLLEMRRRQRFIPVRHQPVNDSLDFIRTMGRLYYDRKDHHNLSKKMELHFQDFVRSRYSIHTHLQSAAFVEELHAKSDYPKQDIESLLSFMEYNRKHTTVTEQQLADFYNQLEKFYATT